MSRYLQRMAASVVKPPRRVHPFVEPMFGGQRVSEALREQVSESSSQRVSETPLGASGALHPIVRDANTKNTEAAARGDLGEPASQKRDVRHLPGEQAIQTASSVGFGPLLPETGSEGAGMVDFVEHGSPTVTGPDARDAAAKDVASGPQRRDRRRDNEEAETAWNFEPLIAASEVRGSFVQPERDGEVAAGAAVAKEALGGQRASGEFGERTSQKRGPSAGSEQVVGHLPPASELRSTAEMAAGRRLAQQQQARAERQGDDIQIHIGRIEVTAMPPTASRPMPVPARKSQTLDEYLRRGSGRAG